MTNAPPITAAEIARLREIEKAASPGPWKVRKDHMHEDHDHVENDDGSMMAIVECGCGPDGGEDAQLIVAARNTLPRLLDEIERLREILCEVAGSGVEFDDERLRYVSVQINRVTWDEIKALGGGV